MFHPAALGGGAGVDVISGGVLSMLTLTSAWAVFPALSTEVPVMDWLVPSTSTGTGAGQVAIPESASLHAKVTVTAVLFHPAAFGAGVIVPEITGDVRSIFTVRIVVELLPAASVATMCST